MDEFDARQGLFRISHGHTQRLLDQCARRPKPHRAARSRWRCYRGRHGPEGPFTSYSPQEGSQEARGRRQCWLSGGSAAAPIASLGSRWSSGVVACPSGCASPGHAHGSLETRRRSCLGPQRLRADSSFPISQFCHNTLNQGLVLGRCAGAPFSHHPIQAQAFRPQAGPQERLVGVEAWRIRWQRQTKGKASH